MTISQALKFVANKLRVKNINNPHLEAEILLSGILKKPHEFLLAHGEKQLSKMQTAKYQQLLKRRLQGEPIAYLTGHKEFYGLDFIVNKNVLIPRPETELMVDEALRLITHNAQRITFMDVGTGSGCIIITLAKLIKNYEFEIKNYKLIGADISKKAQAVAKKNARIHQVNKNINFVKGDLLIPIIHNSSFTCPPELKRRGIIPDSQLVILANLPYGWKAWKNNCSLDTVGLKFEPKVALFTDKNGLGLYEKLFQQIKELRVMRCALCDVTVLCEFDPRQAKLMKKLIKRELPQAKFQIKKDLAGLNRLAIINIPSPLEGDPPDRCRAGG